MPSLSELLEVIRSKRDTALADLARAPLDPRAMAQGMSTAPSETVANIGSNFLPGVGDLVGLAQDANMYWSDPASRRARNYLLTGLGALPFLPALASVGRQTRNVPTSFGNEAGMVAYHGSPHDFDRFDMSKIGTGEGAQAYGHGIYLAENPGVAKSYVTTANNPPITFNGVSPYGNRELFAGLPAGQREALAWAKDYQDVGKAISDAVDSGQDNIASQLKKWVADGTIKQGSGHFYTVDLPDEHIAKMLDWDVPLSEQPEVLAALEQSDQFGKGSIGWRGAPVGMWERNLGRRTGEEIYRDLTGMGWTQQQASDYLRSLGIPGIKYLDGGSRAAGEGTRNFVIFDPDIAKILKRE